MRYLWSALVLTAVACGRHDLAGHDAPPTATIAITPANTNSSCLQNGDRQCKQIWIAAIARNKLTGALDPSSPPMWLPGQSTQADNISPYWSLPPGIE